MAFGKTRGMELKQVWNQIKVFEDQQPKEKEESQSNLKSDPDLQNVSSKKKNEKNEKRSSGSGIDILITHTPPFGILDESSDKIIDFEIATNSSSSNEVQTKHFGDEELILAVKKVKPLVHVFGHIHQGYGTFKTKNTLFINCASKNLNGSMNPPILFQIQK